MNFLKGMTIAGRQAKKSLGDQYIVGLKPKGAIC